MIQAHLNESLPVLVQACAISRALLKCYRFVPVDVQATFFYAFTTLTRSMVALKSVTARWRAQRLQLEAAAAHYVAALKRRAMHAWRAATSWARLKKEQIKVADAWFR
jgi:hypothetical protein